ncbi:unnamed protein product [Arctia plantaginis]|uniref:Uncharacterized protein n=1 Tax=Arctia plantaginis TaxID=874455 RepID=A0A8S0ZU81_ARCPL|nr:unnamed protein product [Arctia plantaginis]CAB3237132.1 unnamed protein product [Arctia plantaginis]CAB3250541.1 unnamed protein product [Arctia plantaginis]CAB3251449.1 unnamed protein product [Arctia plantaginis]CAB3251451.1 unnamed protein product [Arctia plantaginis]
MGSTTAGWIAAWNEIRNPTSEQQNAPIVGHGLVCISCGRLHHVSCHHHLVCVIIAGEGLIEQHHIQL